jgi:hypothetical protein
MARHANDLSNAHLTDPMLPCQRRNVDSLDLVLMPNGAVSMVVGGLDQASPPYLLFGHLLDPVKLRLNVFLEVLPDVFARLLFRVPGEVGFPD